MDSISDLLLLTELIRCTGNPSLEGTIATAAPKVVQTLSKRERNPDGAFRADFVAVIVTVTRSFSTVSDGDQDLLC
ncbi:hypothetical protein WK78_22040 [Burkholderia cepacia]|nr:hypothetical protein WK78_22040 [Burkholderia cepacia]